MPTPEQLRKDALTNMVDERSSFNINYRSSSPAQHNEVVVIQIFHRGQWMDYSRCNPGEALYFLKEKDKDPAQRGLWRAVDWIFKNHLLVWIETDPQPLIEQHYDVTCNSGINCVSYDPAVSQEWWDHCGESELIERIREHLKSCSTYNGETTGVTVTFLV